MAQRITCNAPNADYVPILPKRVSKFRCWCFAVCRLALAACTWLVPQAMQYLCSCVLARHLLLTLRGELFHYCVEYTEMFLGDR